MNDREKLRRMIEKYDNIVFFGGAGVSTGSGIPDFRGGNGLYNRGQWGGISPEYFLSHECLTEEPEAFFDYYRKNMLYPDAVPNAAHKALAKLEKQGKLRAVITQNIDGLHQAAGSGIVYELHGSVLSNSCISCGKKYPLSHIADAVGVPRCTVCGGIVRPDVVMYGEGLDDECFGNAARAISETKMLIVGGTSLTVQPAASLVRLFRGEAFVIINRSSTPYDRYADLLISDDIAETLSFACEFGSEGGSV